MRDLCDECPWRPGEVVTREKGGGGLGGTAYKMRRRGNFGLLFLTSNSVSPFFGMAALKFFVREKRCSCQYGRCCKAGGGGGGVWGGEITRNY